MADYKLILDEPLILDVTAGNAVASIDVYDANGVIADAREEFADNNEANTLAVQGWLAGQLGVDPKALSTNQVLQFADTIVALVDGDSEGRKKKVGSIVSSPPTTPESPTDSSDGQNEKNTPGQKTSPE